MLPSSTLMMAAPAKIAGCSTIVMATPPRPDGTVTPEVLYCAKKAGVTHILKAGGAQVGHPDKILAKPLDFSFDTSDSLPGCCSNGLGHSHLSKG